MSLQPESGSESDNASTGEPVKASTKSNAPRVVLLVFGVVVLLVGFYWGVFTGQQIFQSANHVLYFEPLSRFIGESLRMERIPLWNPYCYSGMSQIANLTPSPFYPFTALFAVLDYNRAVALSLVIHELIALGGTYLLIRSGGYSKTAALAGAFVFMFCGCMSQGSANFTVAWTAAWAPWCLWALLRLQRVTGRARLAGAVAVLSLLFAMNMLAGCIELAILVAGMLKILAVLNAVKSARAGEEFFSSLLRQWSALVLGTMMAAPALLPAVEWAIDKFNYPFTIRGEALANPLVTLGGFVFPLPQPYGFTMSGDLLFHGMKSGEVVMVDHVITCFGPVVVLIAIFGLLDRTWKHQRLVLAAVAGAVAICLTPLQLDLPLARFLPSAFLCHPSAPFMVLLAMAFAPAVARGVLRIESSTALPFASKINSVAKSRISLVTLIALVVSLILCSLINVFVFISPLFPDTASSAHKNVSPAKKRDYARVAVSTTEVFSGDGNPKLGTKAGRLAANRNIESKTLNAMGYEGTPSLIYRSLVIGELNSPFLPALIVPASRAYATSEWTWADTSQQAQQAIRSKAFLGNPKAAVVERNTAQGIDTEKLQQFPSGLMNPPATAPQTGPGRSGTEDSVQQASTGGIVELMQAEPEHVVLSVKLEQPSFVILKDSFYPGWHASVDVIPTACYRANGMVRAVYVDKGAHLVQFDFKPDSYLIGLKCFVTAMAVFFYLVIWSIARLIVKTIRLLSFGVWED